MFRFPAHQATPLHNILDYSQIFTEDETPLARSGDLTTDLVQFSEKLNIHAVLRHPNISPEVAGQIATDREGLDASAAHAQAAGWNEETATTLFTPSSQQFAEHMTELFPRMTLEARYRALDHFTRPGASASSARETHLLGLAHAFGETHGRTQQLQTLFLYRSRIVRWIDKASQEVGPVRVAGMETPAGSSLLEAPLPPSDKDADKLIGSLDRLAYEEPETNEADALLGAFHRLTLGEQGA